ncbi:MAG: hypothetical protein ABFE07_15400 [Armatimonadia bacterium]
MKMLHRMLVVLAIVGLGVALSGCGGGGSSDGGSAATSAYMPLAVGNEWQYKFTQVAQTASVKGLKPRARGIMRTKQSNENDIIRITGTEEIGGSTWYVREALYAGETEAVTLYARHAAQGLLIKEGLADEGYYLLKVPLTVGNTWTVPFEDESLTITGVDQTVVSNGVTYQGCVKVDDTIAAAGEPVDILRSWYAPNIGEVRQERWYGQVLDYTYELVSHDLASD